MSRIALIIPARYGSTRFPGKPLERLGDRSILECVYDKAKQAEKLTGKTLQICVATEDSRISDFCADKNIPVVSTSETCESGSDRVWEAVQSLEEKPDYILNLQGDAPFTPASFVQALIESFDTKPEADIHTPVTQLSWDRLDELRHNKQETPFSGTTALFDQNTGQAFWFSKNIVPAIRKENIQREQGDLSPVYRHIGLYGFSYKGLERFVTLEPSFYEGLEGLEQLRALEAGMHICCVKVDYEDQPEMTGIDTPEDLNRAQLLI